MAEGEIKEKHSSAYHMDAVRPKWQADSSCACKTLSTILPVAGTMIWTS